MEDLILLDTTELLRVMPRKLHAAWAELSGGKARMPPAVADELAPAGVLQSRTTALSVAEELLQPNAPALDDERRQQLERQAWWAAMWRDPESPYEKLDLTREQRELHTTLLSNMPRECFPTANPLLLADNRDTQIVGETLALGGKMLLTSNMRTIDHIRLIAPAIITASASSWSDWCDTSGGPGMPSARSSSAMRCLASTRTARMCSSHSKPATPISCSRPVQHARPQDFPLLVLRSLHRLPSSLAVPIHPFPRLIEDALPAACRRSA